MSKNIVEVLCNSKYLFYVIKNQVIKLTDKTKFVKLEVLLKVNAKNL